MAFVQRWTEREKSALTKQLTASDATDRFKGMGQARRNEAIAFLIGTVPVIGATILFAPYDEANAFGKMALNITSAWAAIILLATFVFVILTLVRIGRAHRG